MYLRGSRDGAFLLAKMTKVHFQQRWCDMMPLMDSRCYISTDVLTIFIIQSLPREQPKTDTNSIPWICGSMDARYGCINRLSFSKILEITRLRADMYYRF